MKSLFVLCITLLLMTILVVNNQWSYGMIYAKYGWFYWGAAFILIITFVDIIRLPNKNFKFSLLDKILLSYVAYICGHSLFYGAISVSIFLSVFLLFVCYFCFRYCFSINSDLKNIGGYVLLCIGLIEALWGGLQLHGILRSYHTLFLVTGSFANPGPYGGFLAICAPLSLYYLISTKKQFIKILSFVTLLSIVSMLPASMSRAAWMAAIAGCGFVLFLHYNVGDYIKSYYLKKRLRFIAGIIILLFFVIAFIAVVIYLKQGSAFGRIFVWKISGLLLLEKGMFGVGLGNFAAAYGERQARYFGESGTILEEGMADCPEYAFNEFIHVFVELGLIGFLFLVLVYFFSLRYVIKNRLCVGFGGGLLALAVFSFFSYPFNVLPFLIYFVFCLACCTSGKQPGSNLAPCLIRLFYTILLIISIPVLKNKIETFNSVRDWNTSKSDDVFERTYSRLNDQLIFLFEYGRILTNDEYHVDAVRVFQRAQLFSCDPMLYNLEGKNHQALHDYRKAEKCFLMAHNLIPSRIYPCYLLAKMYFEEKNMTQAIYWANYILRKNIKIESAATNEIKEEMKRMVLEISDKSER